MSKAFIKESDGTIEEDESEFDALQEDANEALALPAGVKNYMTQQGYRKLREELEALARVERPKIVEIVGWAAGNGDRSENGDYLYGKKRLREIDRRIRFLTHRLESAEVVEAARQSHLSKVFFGATVTYQDQSGTEHCVRLVGIDEAEVAAGKISWRSPVGLALMRKEIGDVTTVRTPSGVERLEIINIDYLD